MYCRTQKTNGNAQYRKASTYVGWSLDVVSWKRVCDHAASDSAGNLLLAELNRLLSNNFAPQIRSRSAQRRESARHEMHRHQRVHGSSCKKAGLGRED